MNRNNVEEIKARLPIEEIVGAYVKLEKAGKSYKAKCPFHNEKTASFFISPERGGYYCFGCGAKGDIFTFVEQFEGLDFRGALKVLAEKAGVQLVYDQKADSERDRLYQAMEEAAKYFELQLEKSKEAQEYVKCRGINEKTRKIFRIGWAPEGWRNLAVYLKGRGFNEAILEKAGLIKKREQNSQFENSPAPGDTFPRQTNRTLRQFASGSVAEGGANQMSNHYDRFRGRIMFPINDSSGRVIAFSGRILKDDGQSAKYLNSPDTPLYDKSAVLFGLDKAKSEIRRMGYSIIVEGQMDLVMSHQVGIRNTVAASGTALTDEAAGKGGSVSNFGLVKRLSPNIIIAFDSDAAGKKAAMRAAGIALNMGMDVKIAAITGGKDPADLVKDSVEKWKDALRNAKPAIEFELMNVVGEAADARKLSKAVAERVLPLLARVPSNSDQSYFVQMISDKAKIPADIVWQDLKVVEKRLKEETPNKAGGQMLHTSAEQGKRIDIVERRLFGLLFLMEKENLPETAEYRGRLRKIAGVSYAGRELRAKAIMSDLAFEAEAFFGIDRDGWKRHAEELLVNFEEDIIGEELIKTMQELKVAEHDRDGARLSELAQRCQALSLRKAEIGKKRRA